MNSICWTNRARFLMIILSILIAIGGFIFLVATWDKFDLKISNNQTFLTAEQGFSLILCLMVQYWILSSIPISFCAYKKKGYKNLKPWRENGIIDFLTFGFVGAFTAALILGPIIEASIIGFIIILTFALIIIITIASIYAIPSELKRTEDKINKETVKNILLKSKGEES